MSTPNYALSYFIERDREAQVARRVFLVGATWALDEMLAGRPVTIEAIEAKLDRWYPRPVRPTEEVAA